MAAVQNPTDHRVLIICDAVAIAGESITAALQHFYREALVASPILFYATSPTRGFLIRLSVANPQDDGLSWMRGTVTAIAWEAQRWLERLDDDQRKQLSRHATESQPPGMTAEGFKLQAERGLHNKLTIVIRPALV